MLDKVLNVLKVSKEEKVDIGVAVEMLKTENSDEAAEYTQAHEIIRNNFNKVVDAWNVLKEVCDE